MAEVVEPQVSRYPAYKPTGVEWMPEIPVGWEVRRLKSIVNYTVGGVWGDDPQEDDNDIACLRVADFDMTILGVSTAKLTYRNIIPSQRNKRLFQRGDLMIEKSGGGENQMVGRCVRFNLNIEAVCSNFVGKISLRLKEANADFVTYHFDALYKVGINTKSIKQTTGIQNLDLDSYLQEPIALPPLPEQRAIARFLDDKTAQLDQLLTQKQQMLTLLREERAALINHAVTKGLNPHAPRRDSGVEWLGEVPAHWEVKRLKWIAEIQGGIALSAGKKLENSVTLPYLRVANVQDGYLDLTEVKTVEVEADQVARYTLHKGDLLMNEGGDNDKLGRGCVWQGEVAPCLHQNHVFAVRLFSGYNPEWLNLITTTEGARTHFMTRAKQSTNLASISSTNIKELPVLLPPIAEQQEIMALVAEETARVAETTDTINQEIALLQEYRAALIAEAVTGQLDVRAYPPVPAAALSSTLATCAARSQGVNLRDGIADY